jgi:4-hydroxymandelate oxidase
MAKWRCTICNYVHEGDAPPEICPVCGAGKDKFVREDVGEVAGKDETDAPKTIEEVRDRARQRMGRVCGVYPACDGHPDRLCQREAYGGPIKLGGAGMGRSFEANVEALKAVKLKMCVVGAHILPKTTFTFLGRALSMPIMASSTAGPGKYDAGLTERAFCDATIAGCAAAGTIAWRGDTYFYTEDAHPGLDALAAADGNGIQIFKPRAQDVLKRLIERAERIGCLAVGVDLDGCGSTIMARHAQPVFKKSVKDIEALVGSTSLPFITKGIMAVEDAMACVDAGAKVVSVSNHGGRVMDSTPGVASVLSDIARAVNGRAVVTADGGVRTGYDVLKMLALGADAVLVGRDIIRAAVGGGAAGVEMQMSHLGKILEKAMFMTGCTDVATLDRSVLI